MGKMRLSVSGLLPVYMWLIHLNLLPLFWGSPLPENTGLGMTPITNRVIAIQTAVGSGNLVSMKWLTPHSLLGMKGLIIINATLLTYL